MKVLILTVTAGGGHNSTASAIQTCFEKRGIDCRVLDAYLNVNRGLYSLISKGYLLSTADFKKTYAYFYAKLEKRRSNSYSTSFTRTAYGMFRKKMLAAIDEYQPDVIVYTHVFAGIMLDVLDQRSPLQVRTIGVLTDFAMHPFWEETLRTDRVVIPNEMLIPAALRKGLREEQIAPIGIPIRPQFSEKVDRAEARRHFGLAEDRTTLLLMGGSMGYGSIAETLADLDALPSPMQILCVCGSNQKAKEEIDGMTFRHTVKNFGYTDEVSLMMDAADCIVTKPGGLTTSEALAKRLPMVICNPIPGQEDRNTEFLLNNGAAVRVSKTSRLSDVIYQLFLYPNRIELMKQNIDLIRKPNATENLADLAEMLAAEMRT